MVVGRKGEVQGRCVNGLGEPDVIIQLDVESGVEWVWERCMRAVKVLEVGPIKWFHWANGRGKEGDVLGMVFEVGGLRGAEFAKAISAITEQFDNFIGASETVRKFGDVVSVGFALDLDADHDDVVEGEEVLGAGFIHLLSMVSMAFICEIVKDGGGEGGISLSKMEEVVDISNITSNRLRGWLEGKIEGKFKFTAGGSNAVYNFSAIDAAAVPGVGGTMSRFNENLVGAMIICINGEYLVEELPEMLYTNSFVIASGGSVQADR